MTEDSAPARRTGLASIRPPIGAGAEALSLADQIATQLAEAIVAEEFAPGDRIHEVAISERFQVSRGPVREALRILENAGLVTILPRRGAIVTKLTVEEVQDVFEIRAVLVSLACRRLAASCPPEVTERLVQRVAELEALAQRDDPGAVHAYVAITQELSFALCAGTGSERLTAIVYSLFHQTLRYTRLGLSTPERRRTSSSNWRQLLEAIQAGDAPGAEALGRSLVDRSREAAVALLTSGGQDGIGVSGTARPARASR